jgi:hypothetical protein
MTVARQSRKSLSLELNHINAERQTRLNIEGDNEKVFRQQPALIPIVDEKAIAIYIIGHIA